MIKLNFRRSSTLWDLAMYTSISKANLCRMLGAYSLAASLVSCATVSQPIIAQAELERADIDRQMQDDEPSGVSPGVAAKIKRGPGYIFDAFTQSQETYISIICPPDLSNFGAHLDEVLKELHQGEEGLEFNIHRSGPRRFSVQVAYAKSLVLPELPYWELVDINISVVGTGEKRAFLGEQFQFPYNSPIMNASRTYNEVFEIIVVASGRFHAGGRPSSLSGFKLSFEAENYESELEDFANLVLMEAYDLSFKAINFNARTGSHPTSLDLLRDIAGAKC